MNQPQSNRKRVAPTKLAHLVFRCVRFAEMKHWYETVLEAWSQFENDMLAFLTYDDEHHRIALINLPGLAERPRMSAGLDHVAFTYGSMGDLVHTYQRLKAAGITPYWCVNHGPTTSMYYRDPDGNQVELQIDNFPSVKELNDWFKSGAFERNPIGVNYDPDQLAARFDQGVPVDRLVRQGWT
jgi:catechol-2,3-dioxygenase